MGLRAALPAAAPLAGRRRGGDGLDLGAARADPALWAYNTSKGAVVNLVRAAALDLAREGIRVNGVCPGPTLTGMTAAIEAEAPDAFEMLRHHVPLQRWGEAREVAAAICFLASPDASFVTGALLPVDGGVTASTGQFTPPPRDEGGKSR